jgi:virulence-associated protein VapD
MGKEESVRFSEAFSHFHTVMTNINGQWLQNSIYLNENFITLWSNNTPKEMLEICMKHAAGITSDIINISKKEE